MGDLELVEQLLVGGGLFKWVQLCPTGDPSSGHSGAFAQGFAAGALLAMVADTMLPEAYEIEKGFTGSGRRWLR